MIFNGRNIIPNAPEELTKVVYFLNEKADVGEFEFSEKPSYWAKHEGIIKPLGLGHDGAGSYFAVSLAFIAVKKDGNIEKSHTVNDLDISVPSSINKFTFGGGK